MTPDCGLLGCYARTRSEDAFAEVVRRHVNLVCSAALRQVNGDTHLAQDVAQTVFADLARKAAQLSRRANVSGWLYTSAHFAAAEVARTENRRRDREEQYMREPIHENPPAADWEKLRPVLDDAMHELKETDREAILWRFFENRPFAKVGARLGLNENAARMRVDRALEKLQAAFLRRGVAATSALASVISANAIQMAPAGLATTVVTTSLAGTGTGVFTLLKIMSATQLKLGVTALVIAGVTTALIVQHQAQTRLREENRSLRQQIAQRQTANESIPSPYTSPGDPQTVSNNPSDELLKLRGEVSALRRQVDDADQRAQYAEQKLALTLSAKAQFEAHQVGTINATKILGVAVRLYADDNGGQFPTNLLQLTGLLGSSTDSWTIEGIDLWGFEFVNAGAVSSEYPDMVVLRERLARQAPDRTWQRVYCFADGSAQTATSYDGNFDAWEKANTDSPPANQ